MRDCSGRGSRGDDEEKTEKRVRHTEKGKGRCDTLDFVGNSLAGGHYFEKCG